MTVNRNTPGGQRPANATPDPAEPAAAAPADMDHGSDAGQAGQTGRTDDTAALIARLAAALDTGQMTLDQVVSTLTDQVLNTHLPEGSAGSADLEARRALLQSLVADDPLLSELVRALGPANTAR